jgi:hypothetical protein
VQEVRKVLPDLGGPINESKSYRKFERYRAAQREHGVSHWAIEKSDGAFVGYAGVMPRLSKIIRWGRISS